MAERKVVPASDLPDNLVPASDLPEEPASMTKQAAPQRRSGMPENDPVPSALAAVANNYYVQATADMIKKAALPMAGSTAGAGIGTALGGPAGAIVGESIGSGVGEATNQIMGVTEPSLAEIGLAMASGPATRGVLWGLRRGGAAIASAFGGRAAITDIATDVAAKMFGPKTPSDELFDIASKLKGNVPTARAGQAVDSALQRATTPSDVSKTIKASLGDYKDYFNIGAAPRGHDIAQVATDVKDLRWASSGALKSDNSGLYQAIKSVRSGLLKDAEDAGFPELTAAAKAYRREMSTETLGTILRQPNPLKKFNDAIAGTAKDQLFAQEWSKPEVEQIKGILRKLERVAPSGFAGVAGRTITTLTGEALGTSAAGKIAGGTAGFVLPDLIAGSLQTARGRKFVEKLLTESQFDVGKFGLALGQFARAQTANEGQEGQIGDAIRTFLKGDKLSIDDKIKASTIGALMGGTADILP